MDFEHHLIRQMAWSHANFGPGKRQQGVIDHIRKELVELEESDGDVTEWVDVVILALDGLTRRLAFTHEDGSRINPEFVARSVCEKIKAKQAINENRVWPDWRKADTNKAIEHIRS